MTRLRLSMLLLAAAATTTGCGYNRIQQLDEQVNQTQGQIETQIQRRADLIPNLVNTVKGVMQYERETLDRRLDLPRPSIDTGMGLERIAAVLQGKHDNYDIDLFRALIDASAEASGIAPDGPHSVSHRVIADHLRASSFLIADGVLPGNEGRGYVLRRIMRRAIRAMRLLGWQEPALPHLLPVARDCMAPSYPELADDFERIAQYAYAEEDAFLSTLRAGHDEYVVDEAALAYMRSRALAGPIIELLAAEERHFPDRAAWAAHLERLGIAALTVTPDPVRLATEGALWGAIQAHGLLPETVIISDDAGQFAIGLHGLCWVHAERLVHRLDTFTGQHRAAQQRLRALIWWFYADLKAYRREPSRRRRAELRARFDRIFRRRTGFVMLDRLLERLHANKAELLQVLDHPEIPLHTNGSENDIRAQVTRRKVSGGTRSDMGRDCRDAFLGLAKTCTKLGLSLWDYLGARLGIPGQAAIPYLPDLVQARCRPA